MAAVSQHPSMPARYDWKRYWCPRNGEINLDLEGYLYDPETAWGAASNSSLKVLADLDDGQCTVFLGESGIGKSDTLKAERGMLQSLFEARGDVVTWVDLLAIGTPEQFEREVLAPLRTTQVHAERHHYLFLDGLDESLLRLASIKTMLTAGLAALPARLVRLRIACRTAEWPNSLEKELRTIFGKENVAAYELAPLRKRDVAEAIRAEGLDPEDVLAKIDAAGAVPFAIKPVTLKFLLNRLARGGGMPTSRRDLYEEGCRQLAAESEHRQESRLAGALSSDQRLAIARRIAALTLLTNHRQIFFGKDEGDSTEADILSDVIADGSPEPVKTLSVASSTEAVQDALRAGLFKYGGEKRLGWAHQSYAEYLAATYLTAHGLSWVQVRSLFLDPGDGNVIPQLRGIAAWMAALDREAFEALVTIDPLILLASDAVTLDADDRRAMTRELLRLAAAGAMGRIEPLRARVLRHLAYDGLGEQLRPVVEDLGRPEFEREIALDITFHARVVELAPVLVRVANDDNETLSIRTQAGCIAARIGADVQTRAGLKPLLQVDRNIDKLDQLRGCALEALWPESLTTDELLAALLPPQRTNYHGTYQSFLESHPLSSVDRPSLLHALEWLVTQETAGKLHDGFKDLGDDIVRRSWDESEDTEIRARLGEVALLRSKRFDSLVENDQQFAQRIANEHDRRRALAEEVLQRAKPEDKGNLLYGDTTLFNPAVDVEWFATQIDAEQYPARREAFEEMFAIFTGRMDDAILQQFWAIRSTSTFVAEKYRWIFEGITLGSPEAQASKAAVAAHEQRMAQIPKRQGLPKPIAEMVEDTLTACEGGQTDAFITLQYQLQLTTSPNAFETFDPNLLDTPGWKDAPPDRRERIVQTAAEFILHGDPDTASWIGTNRFSPAAPAGFRAFALLALVVPERLKELSIVTWRRWATALLATPLNDSVHELRPQLLRIAYVAAPEELRAAIRPILLKESEGGHVGVLREFRATWDAKLTAATIDLIRSEPLNASSLASVFDFLLDVDLAGSVPVLKEMLAAARQANDRERIVALCVSAFVHATEEMWPEVWDVITSAPDLANDILMAGADGYEFGTKRIAHLTETQLADLYLLMSSRFPHADDPEPASGFVAPHVQARWFRDNVLRSLSGRATPAACDQIRRLIDELPALRLYLVQVLRDTEARRRAGTWTPATPREILALAQKNDARFVETEDDLLNAVRGSLARFQKRLHAEETAVLNLWNEPKKGHEKVYTPKDEDSFARIVAQHFNDDLKGRGIVVNREVKVREGERTDIYVDAIAADGARITIVIEAKGCWNPDLFTAMRDQLVDRYLLDARATRGMYLVGWFYCDNWSDADKVRKAHCPSDKLAMTGRLEEQANDLSSNERRVDALVIDAALRFPVANATSRKSTARKAKAKSKK
jgi:hypothetical protein